VKTTRGKKASRWGIITISAIILVLLVGGTIYAQGFGPGRGNRFGGGGMGGGCGMGRGMGQGMGPGMMGGHGMEGGGPGRMMGMEFLMQDEEIRDMMMQVKIIEAINKLDLTNDQVERLLTISNEAQGVIDGALGDTREQIKLALKDQLDAAMAGQETDPEAIRTIMEQAREEHENGDIREQMQGIMERANEIFTDEQRQIMMEEAGPGPDDIQEREQNWQDRGGPGQEWFQNLPEEQRDRVQERFGERLDQTREGAVHMKLMMLLMSPKASETLQMWLDAH
jgi:hypothetical protein